MDEISKNIEMKELLRDLSYKSEHSRLSALESRSLRILQDELKSID